MGIVIKVENLGKKYIISHQQERYTALRDVMADTAKKAIKKVIGKGEALPKKEEFWALRNIDFEVNAGDRIGIIGRNGAGKSTLLKLLSRITEPTEGKIKIKGKIASLLEVGTGFHNELTGKENIFLNGAVLGMSKKEILKKMDDIVEFSGVEKFLDTPVKRYSSGMYVRLAFAVAANLETEILLVDEVLAVGDAEFQKKCLGKMEDVSNKEGRTILFVSHNMGSIKQLSSNSILLDNGKIIYSGDTDSVIDNYLMAGVSSEGCIFFPLGEAKPIQFESIKIKNKSNQISTIIPDSESVVIEIDILVREKIPDIYFGLILQNSEGINVLFADSRDNPESLSRNFDIGEYTLRIIIPPVLSFGKYFINISVAETKTLIQIDRYDLCESFELVNTTNERSSTRPGLLNLHLNWELF